MKVEVKMPKLSAQAKEGVLVSWKKNIGDRVNEGEVLFEVETEKVVSEVEAPSSGVLEAELVEEGDRVQVGDVLAVLDASK